MFGEFLKSSRRIDAHHHRVRRKGHDHQARLARLLGT
jgi:hypothetical protein